MPASLYFRSPVFGTCTRKTRKTITSRPRATEFPILAPRGEIQERDDRVIVDNHSLYSLILTRENLNTEHLRTIADGLHLDYNDLVARVNRYASRPKYDPIIEEELTAPAEASKDSSKRASDDKSSTIAFIANASISWRSSPCSGMQTPTRSRIP